MCMPSCMVFMCSAINAWRSWGVLAAAIFSCMACMACICRSMAAMSSEPMARPDDGSASGSWRRGCRRSGSVRRVVILVLVRALRQHAYGGGGDAQADQRVANVTHDASFLQWELTRAAASGGTAQLCLCSAHGLDVGDDHLPAFLDDHELHLVAGLELGELALVADGEDHRHSGHVQVLDVPLLEGDLAVVRVDLPDLAIGHGVRSRRRHLEIGRA